MSPPSGSSSSCGWRAGTCALSAQLPPAVRITLIDVAGARGRRVGSAQVSSKHANFIQADDGGRAADVRAVIEHVRARIAAEHGIALRSEVRLVGFPDSAVPVPGIELP